MELYKKGANDPDNHNGVVTRLEPEILECEGKWALVSQLVSSVAQSCLTLCDPMDCRTPGFSVHQQLSEPTQTHIHHVGDTIQPSHLLSSLSPPAFNLSQHQGLDFR